MSNKRRGYAGDGGEKRSRRFKHLYLVLDDWTKGYSIHKIQADSFDSDSDSGSDDQHSGAARHLPEPPTLRLECPVGTVPHPGMSFSALGTKIFTFMNQRCSLIYDTKTAAMTIGAHAPADMVCGFGITVVVDEMLHALSYHFRVKQHSFGFMSWGSTAPDALQQPTEGWSWKTLPPPPPTFHRRVNSYALHPDGCTIFMSTANFMTAPSKGCMGTYSFNTKDSVWRWHGEWALPFSGQAHFDRELNAWVGLHRDGYISACQVASPSCHSTTPTLQLDCQTTKEKLFCKDRKPHMGVSLSYVGMSKFCLVQRVEREGLEEALARGDYAGCVLHITLFGLKFNHKGELQITDHRSTRSFIVSRHKDHFMPVAFWM
ncbi:uncharacterized protein LOC119329676 [Triticum dicoccoides]|uniref:Uncharacterized protein n=1 Tax=Triticum turgidum subsp. durum TaxID=4567 RepID=A0A9R0Z9Q6_TRITD|nr:uncharacterized protein LOC119329676 [Triticum dicoccoides]VAI73973.1 unnamed protein product [Triticum turgidum subsp. durum]